MGKTNNRKDYLENPKRKLELVVDFAENLLDSVYDDIRDPDCYAAGYADALKDVLREIGYER